MMSLCSQLPQWLVVSTFVGYQIFEWIMGKTQFGSTIGLLIEAPLTKVFNWIKAKINAV